MSNLPLINYKGKIVEVVRSEIEHEEVTHSKFIHVSIAAQNFWVMYCGSMVVPISGEEIEILEFGNGSEGILATLRHQGCQQQIDGSSILQAASTHQAFEEETYRHLRASVVAVALDEIAPGARVAQAT